MPSRIPNKASGPVSASWDWCVPGVPNASRLPANAASILAPVATVRSLRSCATTSTGPTARRPCRTSRPFSTATFVAAATTIEEDTLLHHPTTDRLRELGLVGMARALEEMRRQPDSAALDFEDRLALMVDRERLERDTKRLHTRLRFAGLRVQATPEDGDYRAARGLDRAMFQKLTGGEWIAIGGIAIGQLPLR